MGNLTVMIQYFWVLKLITIVVFAYVMYKAVITHKLKSKLWDALLVILFLLIVVTPVKISVNTPMMHKQQEMSISNTKVLIEKVEDKSFEDAMKALKGIQKSDIEQK